jgi:anthranilate/para-aminobenzoate synthase component I
VLVARRLLLAPDPVAIARRLTARGGRGLALLHANDPLAGRWSRWSFVAVDPDRDSFALDPLDDDEVTGGEPGSPSTWSAVPRWIGVVPYEALRDIERRGWTPRETRTAPAITRPVWRRYPAVVAVDHHGGTVFAVGAPAAVAALAARCARGRDPGAPSIDVAVEDAEPLQRHVERVVAARELIGRGDLYQVNLARPLRLGVSGGLDAARALALHTRLVAAAPTPFACCLADIDDTFVLSTSPELLLRAGVDAPAAAPAGASCAAARPFSTLLTAPIKGTRPRGRDADEDEALARELDRDPKERAELTMIMDVERHDLGRVAVTGSVRVVRGPVVVTHRTVHHRAAWIRARVREGAGRTEVLRAMLPSGSVTGAPKVRAMEVIATLEAHRRGLYTGAIGYVAHDGSVELAMAIRTAVVRGDGEGQYLAGGGIVWDSDPQRELEETRWKALQLARAAGR